MAEKNNLRSVRLSDETLEAIEAQIGRNFTEKLENMIARCMWELPATEEKLKELEREIGAKRQELQELWKSCQQWRQTLQNINIRLMGLENALRKELEMKNL